MGFNNVGEIIFNPGKFSVAERAKAIQTTMCLMEVTVNQQIEECLKLRNMEGLYYCVTCRDECFNSLLQLYHSEDVQ